MKGMNLETMKDMSMKDMNRKDTSKNGKGAMLGLIVIVCLALAGCGGGGAGSSASSTTTNTPEPTGNTSTGHPHGMWSTLPSTMPINPVHAALLHTGKVLIVSGSGNCPPQQAGCPQGPQYPQGAALLDLTTNTATPMPITWDMFCNGMSIMQDGRVLINGGTKGYGALAVVGAQGEIPFTGLANTSIFDPCQRVVH